MQIVNIQVGNPTDTPGAIKCEGVVIEKYEHEMLKGKYLYTIVLADGKIGCLCIKSNKDNDFKGCEYYCTNTVSTHDQRLKAIEVLDKLDRPLRIIEWSDRKKWDSYYKMKRI